MGVAVRGISGIAFLPDTATPTTTITGVVAVPNGGTGLAVYTVGDVLYADTTVNLAKRGIGGVGDVLTVAGGVPTWATPIAATDLYAVAFLLMGGG